MAAYHLFAAIFVVLFLGLKANEDNLADITDQEIKDYLEKYPGDVSLFPLNRDGQFQASTDVTGYWRTTTTTRPRYRQTTTDRPRYRLTTTAQPRYRQTTTTTRPRYRRTTTDRPRYRLTTTAQPRYRRTTATTRSWYRRITTTTRPWYRRTTTTTRPWFRRTRTTTRPLYRQTTTPTQPWNMHRRITTNRPWWYRHKEIPTQAPWNLQITNPWGYIEDTTTQSLLNGLFDDTDLPMFDFPTLPPILPAEDSEPQYHHEHASSFTKVSLSLTGFFVIMVTIIGIRCAVAKSRRRRLLAQLHGQTQSGVIVGTVAPTSRNQQPTTSRRCYPIGAIVIVRRVLCIRARPLADDGDEGQLVPAEPVSPPTYEQTVTAPVSEDTAPPPYSSLPPAYTEV